MPADADQVSIQAATSRWSATQSGKSLLIVLLALFPILAAYGILYRQSFSVPYQDDYHAILDFSIGYEQLPTLRQKLLMIAAYQHNEYKLGFEHSIQAAELEATHHLNFGFLVALGDLFLLPIGYLLWKIYAKSGEDLESRLFEFLPIGFLFFSLTYWETLNWAMAGMQNIPVILFSLMAIYLVTPKTMTEQPAWQMAAGCLAAAFAALTSANGFLLAPVGLLIFFARRAYFRSLVWCASFIFPIAVYLYRFVPGAPSKPGIHHLTKPLFFVGFLGGAVPFRWAAALLGFAVLAVILLAYRSGFHRQNPAGFYFSVWVLETAALVAWVRGASFAIFSRYSVYSILLLIFCYHFLLRYLPSRFSTFDRTRFCLVSLVLAFIFCFAADVQAYKELGERRQMALSGIEFYRSRPDMNSPMIDSRIEITAPLEKAYERGVLTEAIRQRVYTLPSRTKAQ